LGGRDYAVERLGVDGVGAVERQMVELVGAIELSGAGGGAAAAGYGSGDHGASRLVDRDYVSAENSGNSWQ
jgi:hypothetical protein